MYPLIRRYLRRVDVVYLLLCAACSAISVVVLLSIGQTQLGSNNKASVQLIASLLGLMLAVVFSTADYHALARAWPLHGVVAWGLVLPTLFLHNVNTGLVTIGYDAGGTSNYSWYRVGGMTFQPAELAKISFILTLALHLSQVRGQVNRPKNLLLLFVHIALPAAAIHVQGDDGTALVFLGSTAAGFALRQELRLVMPAEEQAGQLRHDRLEGDQNEADAEEGTAIQRPEPDGFEDVLYKIIKNAADVHEGEPAHFDRDEEKQQAARFRHQRRDREEHRQVQIERRDTVGNVEQEIHQHRIDIHGQDADQIIQVHAQ